MRLKEPQPASRIRLVSEWPSWGSQRITLEDFAHTAQLSVGALTAYRSLLHEGVGHWAGYRLEWADLDHLHLDQHRTLRGVLAWERKSLKREWADLDVDGRAALSWATQRHLGHLERVLNTLLNT